MASARGRIDSASRTDPCGPSIRRVGRPADARAHLLRAAAPRCGLSEENVAIEHDWDVVVAQRVSRRYALGLGFSTVEQAAVATAVSEVATNILKFAGAGTVRLRPLTGLQSGLEVEAVDCGPGISDLSSAGSESDAEARAAALAERALPLQSNGLGSGLSAVRRLMDVVTLANRPEGGLRVIARKILDPCRREQPSAERLPGTMRDGWSESGVRQP